MENAKTFLSALVVLFLCRGPALADLPTDVRRILNEHCFDCHGAEAAESKLRLHSAVDALRGGDSGERVIVPGNSGGSFLIEKLTTKNPAERMPPDSDPLAERDINILRRWIDDSEQWKSAQEKLADQKLTHWSFQPVRAPDIPDGASNVPQGSKQNQRPGAKPKPKSSVAIDWLIDQTLQSNGLKKNARADRRTLIRRLYLVMLGLPPTPNDVHRFVNDSQPNAWPRLVASVLADGRYGERWATYWLDLVRFGESTGFETNRERPQAWPYRDWVIDAFNKDLPYDEFVRRQIAGDALGDGIATAFLVAGPNDIVKGQDKLLGLTQRQDELADMIHTTGTAFLGLTIGCARCHNHKFDPISQTDYYAMQAVFAGVRHGSRNISPPENSEREVEKLRTKIRELESQLRPFLVTPPRPPVNAQLNEESFPATKAKFVRFTIRKCTAAEPCIDELEIFAGTKNVALATSGAKATSSGDFQHALHKLAHINDGQYGNSKSWISSAKKDGWVQIEFADVQSIDRIVWARDRTGKYGDRLAVEYSITASADGKQWEQIASSEDRRSVSQREPVYQFADAKPEDKQRGKKTLQQLALVRGQLAALTTRNVYAGVFAQPGPTHRLYRGEVTAPREVVAPAAIESLADLTLPQDLPEQKRRLAIADWITNRKNPLTARVMANRIWQHHFGTGLVDTPSDFGANGTKPTHPELLDWLADAFMRSSWSVKSLQRQILLSDTWQQSSQPNSAALKQDASARLLWRFPPRRLEAEGIRDSILAVTGKLSPQMGGPGFSAFEVQMENVRHYFPKQNFGPDDWRRMVYMTKVRQERDAVFGVFDCPDFNQVVPKRSRSTTPLQALNLLNSRFVMQQADFLAERLEQEATSPADKIARAYELCYSRPASADEIGAAVDFVSATSWPQFARAMLNSNEFVFIP